MIIKEAIILAGGLGTRLRDAVPELPKCMAPVGGQPFIRYVTDYFRKAGIEHFIFALGYKSDYFDAFFAEAFPSGTIAGTTGSGADGESPSSRNTGAISSGDFITGDSNRASYSI